MRLLALPVFILALALPALGSDGVLEINQTCIANGCFPGDDPGLPIQITVGGSYLLTSNLGVAGIDTTAILIEADDVTIDLNGFHIRCRTFVPPATLELCGRDGPGLGKGIAVDTFTRRGVGVHGGTILGMGSDGLDLGREAVVENVRAISNGGDGIHVDVFSRVLNSTARDNGGSGIWAGDACLVKGNTSGGNRVGITFAGSTGVYRENVIAFNTDDGVSGGNSRGDNLCSGPNVSSSFCP